MSPLTVLADTYVGKVLDETGSPLPDAVVTIGDNNISVVTDADGRYHFEVPQKNTVKVSVSYIGFIPWSGIILSLIHI